MGWPETIFMSWLAIDLGRAGLDVAGADRFHRFWGTFAKRAALFGLLLWGGFFA